MLIISSTGGSGSTFVINALRKAGYRVCARPDAGRQKLNQTMLSTWHERVKPFFRSDPPEDITAQRLFQHTYDELKKMDEGRPALVLLEWGAMGFLDYVKNIEKPIYLIRDPLLTINSYSSGTTWSRDYGKRIKYAGGEDHNDPAWIDAFFGGFSWWLANAQNALEAVKNDQGYIVRYYKFKVDWNSIPNMYMLPIANKFKCKNNMKVATSFFSQEAIDYIRSKTDTIWNEIKSL